MARLKTETNTAKMADRIHEVAVSALGLDEENIQVDFEHGQFWVTDVETGAQWAVEDATGPGTVDGFDFEQVTEGDEL